MRKIVSVLVMVCVSGCAPVQPKNDTYDLIGNEMAKAAHANAKAAPPAEVAAALLPPIRIEVPKVGKPSEERFSVSLNNVPAAQFFMSIVSGTRYSMLVHPDVTGTISVNLKDVTLFEALDAVRELYGYDYSVEGTRIYVKPLSLQTRLFHVNYLTGERKGTSDIRVTSGSVSDSSYPGSSLANNQAGQPANSTPGGVSRSLTSSKISTSSDADFWSELRASLQAIVGSKEGRSVIVSPQSGIVVVRAMWDELRNVSTYLRAAQLSVDRQVILDAKIIEVELNDSYQSGVNWSAFWKGANSGFSGGVVSPGSTLGIFPSTLSASNASGNTTVASVPGSSLSATAGAPGTLFGLAFQSTNFAALLSFLETQGTVHVLSSPRIATLNNQKAVLKVGKDQFFVTNVSTTTTATGTGTTTSPTVTVQPFFSGVALDVTPQIDEDGNVILHVHPSVSNVSAVDTQLNLGTAGGQFNLPLASSSISETDSVVRGRNGQIFAIGGLMRQASTYDRSQMPGVGDLPVVGSLFGNRQRVSQKRELVILLKPTVVEGNSSWSQDMLESQKQLESLNPRQLQRQ